MEDIENFEKAYDEYADAIFRYLYVHLKDRERALELTQETFSRAWSFMSKGKEIKMMRPFLYKVAHNLFVNDMRARRWNLSLDQIQEEWGFEPTAEKEKNFELSDELLQLLDQIHPAYKQVIVLRYVEELDIGEIADFLEETENSVSVKLHRAIKSLRKIYE